MSLARPIPGVGAGPRQTTARPSAGFTLIELMVVVAVVAILAAIAYPAYQDQIRKSRRGQAQADLVELAQRAERHHAVNHTYETFWDSVPPADRISPRQGATPAYELDFDGTGSTFSLEAVPQGRQTADSRCMTLTLNHAGVKGIDGGSGPLDRCW